MTASLPERLWRYREKLHAIADKIAADEDLGEFLLGTARFAGLDARSCAREFADPLYRECDRLDRERAELRELLQGESREIALREV